MYNPQIPNPQYLIPRNDNLDHEEINWNDYTLKGNGIT